MENNNAIEQLNEGTVTQFYEEVNTSGGNVLAKVAVVAVIAAVGVGAAIIYKKRKAREAEVIEVINESNSIDGKNKK